MKNDKWWQSLPWFVFYIPMLPWILYTFARHGFKLSHVNTCMDNAGLYASSKRKYLKLLPKNWVPNMNPSEFPMVIKPDNGERGKGVKVVNNDKELENYFSEATGAVLVQEFVDLPNECGIFWAGGEITSITTKIFKEGQPIGSHNLGTTFLDGRAHITPKLNEAFRKITDSLPGFSYGRFDVKFNNFSDLESLDSFKIIEVNGLNSEPTHIYDPSYTLGGAYKDVVQHWSLI